jgi:hypothetical protein
MRMWRCGKWTARLTALLLGIALGPWPVTGANALEDTTQLLTGGNSGSAGGTRFTAPGLGNTYNADFPGTGLGESAAQIRMTAGVLSKLRVKVVTEGTQDSGTVTVMVRLNGADTELTCSVGIAGGECGAGGKSITILNGDLLAIRVASTYNEGFWAYTYTLLYD